MVRHTVKEQQNDDEPIVFDAKAFTTYVRFKRKQYNCEDINDGELAEIFHNDFKVFTAAQFAKIHQIDARKLRMVLLLYEQSRKSTTDVWTKEQVQEVLKDSNIEEPKFKSGIVRDFIKNNFKYKEEDDDDGDMYGGGGDPDDDGDDDDNNSHRGRRPSWDKRPSKHSNTQSLVIIMATIGMVPGIPGTATLGATTLETTPIISHDIPTPQINATNAGYARKRGCRSTKHSKEEQDKQRREYREKIKGGSNNAFNKRYDQWMIEYEGEATDAESDSETEMGLFFADLDIEDDADEAFFVSSEPISGQEVFNQLESAVDIFYTSYTSKEFYGICIDTACAGKSTVGIGQYHAWKQICPVTYDPQTAGAANVRFGKGTATSIGSFRVIAPFGDVDFHIVDADIPFLLSLEDMDRLKAFIMLGHPLYYLERVEKWSTYRLAHVPNVLTGLLDNQLVTADIVSKEAEIQTGSKPVSCHHTQSSGPTSVWYVSFKKEVRSFTLFGSSGYSRLSVKKKSMELHNPGCQEFCNSFHCRAPSKCNNCGVATAKHQGAQGAACTAPPRCAGCYGPFPAGHKHCAAAPKKVDGKFVRPTARQLGEIRRQQLATQKACELAAKRQQERTSKDGVQVVIPTPGARVANYEAANQQTRRVKRKTAPHWIPKPCRAIEAKHSDRIRGRNELYSRQQHGPRCNHFPYPIFMLENGAERCSEDCAIIRANGLKVAWANVGRSGPAHLALLQLAFEEQADVVCIQEPSAYPGTRTQNHPAYECYAPVDAWEQVQAAEREAERPRTMSYTRKAAGLTTQQRRNGTDRDIVWLEPGIHSSNQGSLLAAWSLSSGADFIGDPGEPTHRAGHTIDLTFSNIPFAETKVRHDLDSGSDHFTLVTLIPGRGQQTNANTGYRVAEDSLERFAHIINSGVPLLPRPASAQGPGDLDDIARLLTILFQNAIKAVGKKAQNAARSAPWWTPACAELHASYAKARQRSEPDQERKRRTMLSTIRNAKRDYWRRIIDNAAEDADLYKGESGGSFGKSATSIQRLGRSGLRSPRGGSAATDAPVDDGHLSLEETEKNVIGVSSTSPGADPALEHYQANITNLPDTYEGLCRMMVLNFEGPEHQRNMLVKWNNISFKSYIRKDPTEDLQTIDSYQKTFPRRTVPTETFLTDRRFYNNTSNPTRKPYDKNSRYDRKPRQALTAPPGRSKDDCYFPGCKIKGCRYYKHTQEEKDRVKGEYRSKYSNLDDKSFKARYDHFITDTGQGSDNDDSDEDDVGDQLINQYLADQGDNIEEISRTFFTSCAHDDSREICVAEQERYNADEFMGIMIDTGASRRSTVGYNQYLAWKAIENTEYNPATAGQANVTYGIGSTTSIGSWMKLPFGDVEWNVMRADTPFLFCLADMDRFKFKYDNIDDVAITPHMILPVYRRFGHPFLTWKVKLQNVIQHSIDDGECLLTEVELRRIHRRFGHPSARKFYKVLKRSGHDEDF
ncbi:hypothetical protein DID88_004766 [Monilinia fructigena]|uniref:Endonuclease/exonuclease/phosphatase domain-containing protein n=1 Tax=Monilinia fructigena TaxID=38457 RepID=A0A395IRH0_9HELO|nr:hypothetical protein DID88_004766 [Monilinia fructigena]